MTWPNDPRIKNVDADALRKAFFEEGLTCNEVAARFGISKGTVYYRTRRLGIKLPHGLGRQRKLRLKGLFCCPRCKLDKPFGEFGGLNARGTQPQKPYCRDCATAHQRDWANGTLRGRLSTVLAATKSRAKKRGTRFELSYEDVVDLWRTQGGRCFYTGIEMILRSSDRKGATVSIDRVDSLGGYTKGNVVLCCAVINRMKSDLHPDEFRHWCKLVVVGRSCAFNAKAI